MYKRQTIRTASTKFGNAASKAKSRAVLNIIDSIRNSKLNEEQQVLALRTAAVHPELRLHFKSAGLIDVDEYETLKHTTNQMKTLIQKVVETEKKQGRVNDDKRGFIQSIILAIADTPSSNKKKNPSYKKRFDLLGIPSSTAYRIKKNPTTKKSRYYCRNRC